MWEHQPPEPAAASSYCEAFGDSDVVRVAGCGCEIRRSGVHPGQTTSGVGWPSSQPPDNVSPPEASDARPEDAG